MTPIGYRVVLCCAIACGLLASEPAIGGDQASFDKLIAATKASDETTRLHAIHDLGKEGVPAVEPLVELLRADSALTRAYALRSLATIGPGAKGALDSIVPLLSDSDAGVRRQALHAMVAMNPGPKVMVPLVSKLMLDADPGVRIRVMEAVANAKGTAVPGLVEALKNEKNAYWACLILRDIGPDAVGAVPALVEKLKDGRPEIRREAALALAAIGSPDAVTALVPLLKDDATRTAATFALGSIGKIPADAEANLRENSKASDGMLSTVSLWALARVHTDDVKLKQAAATQLIGRLTDEDPLVRVAAARALAALPPSPEIAGPIFAKALADADEKTTAYLLDAVAGLGAPAVPRLVAALKYKSLNLEIVKTLGRIGPAAAPATPSLAKLLKDEDPNIGIEAANALAKIGPGAKAAVPELVAALADSETNPRYAAAYALGMIGPDAAAAAPALQQIMKGPESSLSLISGWALVKIKGVSAATAAAVLPTLMAQLKSPLPQSREVAAETLGGFGPLAKSALPQLERLAKDGDEHVREAAGQAIKSIRK